MATRTRKVIWAGFSAMIFATIMGLFVIHMPGDPDEPFNAELQPALELVFGNTGRIVAASIVAYWCGDFVNSYVMAKMKVWTEGVISGPARSARRRSASSLTVLCSIRLPSSGPGSPEPC